MANLGSKEWEIGTSLRRFADGKVVERWNMGDSLGMMQQLGIIPPMGWDL